MANWKVSFEIDGYTYEANVKADDEVGAIKELSNHWKKISKTNIDIIDVKKINHPQ